MRKHWLYLAFIFVFSLFMLRSLLSQGMMYTHDSIWHVERLSHMFGSLRTQFPLRWSHSLDHGYGAPLFNFIYPGPYYLGSIFMFVGLGPLAVFNLLLFGGYLLGGVGIYFLAKKPSDGLLAGLIYLTIPYQFLDIFVRGALGEVIALGIIPWILLVYTRQESSKKLLWYSPFPLAILIISHNFYGYLFCGILLLLMIFVYKSKKNLLMSFLLSLGLSAFFILPAFIERPLLLSSQSDPVSYRDHFVYPSQLLDPTWRYLGSQLGFDKYEMSYQLGISTIAILILSIYLAFRAKLKVSRAYLAYLGIAIISIFMLLPASDFLWSSIPLLSSLQFPWRFLGVIAVMTPLLYLELVSMLKGKLFYVSTRIVLTISIILSFSYTKPLKTLTSEEFLTLHYQNVGGTTTAHREEIVPKWSKEERYQAETGSWVKGSGEVTVSNLQDSSGDLSFDAVTGEGQTAIVARNYYPSWRATVDDLWVAISPSDEGDIVIPLVPGNHHYTLTVVNTRVQLLGNYFTLASLLLCLFVFYQNIKAGHSK